MRSSFITLLILGAFFGSRAFAIDTELASYVKIDDNYNYKGLTPAGIAKLEEIRDALKFRKNSFNNRFLDLETVHHAATLARMVKDDVYFYGPPGSGKSSVVKWFINAESKPAFQMQLHQMTSEQAFIGGQNFEKAKLGQFEINTEGSLADYEVALIDEADKGSPAVLSVFLNLLEEGEIQAGNKVIKAKLETVFATSNANLPEIFEQFAMNGLATTAPAFLNRFMFKIFVYNWLKFEQRKKLIENVKKESRLKALANVKEKTKNHEIFAKVPTVDWKALRFFASILVTSSDLFDCAYNELTQTMHDETHKAIRESEANVRDRKEQFVYFPSCEFNTRNLLRIPEVIAYSAFLDFLLSSAADDIKLATSSTIELGPLSLWRAYLVMTTIGPGKTSLTVTENDEVTIDFGNTIDLASARDERERGLIINLQKEQQRFQSALNIQYQKNQEEIKKAVKFSRSKSSCTAPDFELWIQQ